MRPIAILLFMVFAGLGCSRKPSVPAPSPWDGDYTYEAYFGRAAGGTGMTVTYQLHLHGTACTVSAEGFQTDDNLLCTLRPTPSGIDVLYRSYSDGSIANSYGVELYHPGDLLFALSHSPHRRLITRWAAYGLLDGKSPPPGVYFRRNLRGSSAAIAQPLEATQP